MSLVKWIIGLQLLIGGHVRATFTPQPSTTLNRLAVNSENNDIFVGATNRIFHLDSSLNIIQDVSTGPHLDNTQCFQYSQDFTTCVDDNGDPLTLTTLDNANKLLVPILTQNQLLTCGSLYQGMCEVRQLSNLSRVLNQRRTAVFHDYVLAGNTADQSVSSTAFVAPGKMQNDFCTDNNNVLYVGTATNHKDLLSLRKDVPFLSSRKLDSNTGDLTFAVDTSDEGGVHVSRVRFASESYERVFRAGFSHGGFSYFLTWDNSEQTSKIIQVCQSDCEFFEAYVEMPLVCTMNGANYEEVVSATLTDIGMTLQGSLSSAKVIAAVFKKRSETGSALCIYTVTDVRRRMTDNLQTCFDDSNSTPLGDHLQVSLITDRTCKKESMTVSETYCGDDQTNYPLSGSLSLSRDALWTTSEKELTSVAVTVVHAEHTVAFMGTSEGTLEKVRILASSSEHYATVQVESSGHVLPDTQLQPDQSELLLLTQRSLYKWPLSDCSQAQSCSACLNLRDPYCGWCELEQSCTTRTSCPSNTMFGRWKKFNEQCLSMTVTPKKASVSTPAVITLEFSDELPAGSDYDCVFSTTPESVSVLQRSRERVYTCNKPSYSLPDGLADQLTEIRVRAVQTGEVLLAESFEFYNCSRRSPCSQCTDGTHNCQWCVHHSQCIDHASTCSSGPVETQQTSCPRIMHTDTSTTYLPEGVPTAIMLTGSNLPKQSSLTYECLIHVQAPPIRVPATVSSMDVVMCQERSYMAVGTTERHINVEVVFNNDIYIEDESTQEITFYSCANLAPDCSQCRSLELTRSELRCSYCSQGCSFVSQCTNRINTCPPPSISAVTPLSAPTQGGTLVTVRGMNLGAQVTDVQVSVELSGRVINCAVITNLYNASTGIVCRIDPSGEVGEGDFTVNINGRRATYDVAKFTFRDPVISGLDPERGPVSGGTRVTVTGTDLDTGAERLIRLAGVECEVLEANQTQLVCLSAPVAQGVSNPVSIQFDGDVQLNHGLFTYTPDPAISQVYTRRSTEVSGLPKVTFSGGITVIANGTNLDVVQQPRIYLENGAGQRSQAMDCTNQTNVLLHCKTPSVTSSFLGGSGSSSRRRRRQTPGQTLRVGYIMDGVQSVEAQTLGREVQVVSDPVFENFTNGLRIHTKQSSLELPGMDLNLAVTVDEVVVLIGAEPCEVRTMSSTTLFCDPPEEQPESQDGNELPLVVVQIGSLTQVLGRIQYEIVAPAQDPGPPVALIIGAAVAGFVLVMLIIIIVIVYNRKSSHAERQYRKLQQQLDTLESNVRNECKQAFAELQTEVSDFTSDINQIGIPYWDYKTYTFKVLFPAQGDHPVLHTGNGPQYVINKYGSYERSLQQFNQLLCSEHFLIIFIRTLDQQTNFSARDKAQVASFLTIVLQDKMEYATEILQRLLGELISRLVEKKCPKLMLRRTESVVEKLLTNWLSVCMHSYLQNHAGRSLFMLYQGIKRQTEKGPVDAITASAKYSLSEDRLLRQKIDHTTLTIHIVTGEEREPVSCKVLNCDTITQAKQKCLDALYLNHPFTTRPSVHDVDLEWRSGKTGHLPLQDEDVTTDNKEKGWKKINTLAHYHVPDGAVVALILHERFKNTGMRQVHGRVEITTNGTSSLAPLVTVEEGSRAWHLIKPDDGREGVYVSRTQKVISEIFLTRLLTTKGTLQQYIDDLFSCMLRPDATIIPQPIKWLFDFFDQSARRHGITDPDVVTTWKSNSLPLRFWVNIIKNPDFVFDIEKSHIVDSCLSAVAQTFMDSCSTAHNALGKDSPSNKLLFARDIPRYREMVMKYYQYIKDMPPISDQEIKRLMTESSLHYAADFNVPIALKELFRYAQQYSFELQEALDEDSTAKRMRLANCFDEIMAGMEGTMGTTHRNTMQQMFM